jgi:hypothetical protein
MSNRAIDERRADVRTGGRANEFYKKGCQEKSSASTGVEILSRHPAHCSFTSLEKFGLLSILVSFSADSDAAVEF